MIDIKILDNLSDDAISFVKDEWTKADVVHFGRKIQWSKEKKVFQAYENDIIVGVLELTIQAGVMYIDEVIIKQDKQGQGLGRTIMQKAEDIAREQKLHKIYLDTGKDWPAAKFYEALGYEKTGELPNHFENADYVVYSKFL
ncbi:MAG TPA: GNAT family N-acetyltransferase [Patescibacteria group bacterium]|nr:GNAT family N-acetyltransferase [Patescibacteria group bacterium]